VAETSTKDLETKLASANSEKEAVELERDSLKEKKVELEEEVKKCKGALAEYYEDGFECVREQALYFYPEADLSVLDSFKIVIDGKLVDEE
jgi:chromosome segregation ATPase